MEIIRKESTGSTNDDVIELARQGYPHLTTVVTNFQTSGRGRQGNRWMAPPGNCLLFSTLIRSESPPENWIRIPQIAGMEIIQSTENLLGHPEAELKMKWPNDLYYCDKKWAGVLVESRLGKEAFAILGIGVNCRGSADDFDDWVKTDLTTLEEIFKTPWIESGSILETFLQRISENLDRYLEDFEPVVRFANQRDYLLGRRLTVQNHDSRLEGIARGIGQEGELKLEKIDGSRERIFGGSILRVD